MVFILVALSHQREDVSLETNYLIIVLYQERIFLSCLYLLHLLYMPFQ